MPKRIYLMNEWQFAEEFIPEYIKEPMAGENIKKVRLPHNVKDLPFNYFDETEYQMLCCYQRNIWGDKSWEGMKVMLTFEAVGHEATVYLNGEELGTHQNGYTAFTVDLTNHIKLDQYNLLTVKVDTTEQLNQPPFGFVIDYLTYGGIYRDVYIELKSPIYMEDVFLKPSLSTAVDTSRKTNKQIATMETAGVLATEVTLSEEAHKLFTQGKLGIRQLLGDKVILESPNLDLNFSIMLSKVKLWDIESPSLYEVKTQLLINGVVVDESISKVGFRSAHFKKQGFYLNGRRVELRGLNRHQSFAYVGYAMPESMQRYDAKILKQELGVNTVRTSHYPQSHYFIDECDKLGLLVVTEFPGWQHIGNDAWKDIAVENVRQMITQYRNHPSIILWGVRINESADDDEFYSHTNDLAHMLDDTRATGGVRNFGKSNLLEDVYTYNEFVHTGDNQGCDPAKKITSDPEKPYLITEFNGHMFPTKAFDDEEHRRDHMLRHANVLNDAAGQENISGAIGWCMFDYNTHKDFGSGDRICYHGVMDMFRNPKLAASVYAAQGVDEPVLAVCSSMDIGEHPACSRGKTYFISNADSVRMYKNDALLKEYYPSDSTYKNLANGPILIDDFVGNIVSEAEGFKGIKAKLMNYCLNGVAVGGYKFTAKMTAAALVLTTFYRVKMADAINIYTKYVGDWGGSASRYRFDAIRDGKVVKTVVCEAATQVKLQATVSHTALVEKESYDVAAIRLKALDQNSNVLPYFAESVAVDIEGPAELIGPATIPLRGGMAGLYIKSTGQAGAVNLKLSCLGTEDVNIAFTVELQQ